MPRYPVICLSIFFLIVIQLLTACGPEPITATGTPTSLPETPTATPIPLALTVNGDVITRTEFESEVERYQAAQSALNRTSTLEQATQAVLDELINQFLLIQGATEMGFSVDDDVLQERIDNLVTQVGSEDALTEWIDTNGYTQSGFQQALSRAIVAAWMRDQIAGTVPSTTEQVHARQILLYNLKDAEKAMESLAAGYDFDALAALYDPVTKGELGWFPRGYLLESAIEEAVFSLQTGEYSQIIQSSVGYHILKVIERDENHILSPDAHLALQNLALADWLRQRRAESTIILAP